MANTLATEVIESFEATFQDKCVIPEDLELMWLKKAVAAFSIEIEDLPYDPDEEEFGVELDQYTIDTLAQVMRVYYQEREVSKVNKRVGIVSKDISINSGGHDKTAARNELEHHVSEALQMFNNQKETAYV